MAGEGVVILPLALASAALIGGDPTKLALEVRDNITGLGRCQVRKCLPLKLEDLSSGAHLESQAVDAGL